MKTTKLTVYKNVLALFLDKLPNDELILNYLNGYESRSNDGFEDMQNFIGLNLKSTLHWSTSIGIIDAIDIIIKEAISNGNIKIV